MDDDFDEDFESEATQMTAMETDSPEEDIRAQELGFKPQKEIIYNKLLPYSDLLDEESKAWFAEIKLNLCKSLALRELRPGFVTWMSRLNKYIRFYGFKFAKEDHVCLVRELISTLGRVFWYFVQ